MSDLYNRIYGLCQKKNISIGKMCNDLSISRGNLTELKMDRIQTLRAANLTKISDYFGVSIEKPAADSDGLTAKDRRDIARDLEKMMAELEESGDLMFDGDPASPEALESIRQAMAMALEYAKKVNKEKYTPKKYRK